MQLHPDKTKVVFCRDSNRVGEAEHTSFDFLGYTFRGRFAKGRWGYFVSFAPAISTKAVKAIGQTIRGWRLRLRTGSDLTGIAEAINPVVRGWFGYYGAFYRSELEFITRRLDLHLVKWAMHKYKRLKGRPLRAWAWLHGVRTRVPGMFAHWVLLPAPR